jgi:23S rRNA pseudouridine2457 synthase
VLTQFTPEPGSQFRTLAEFITVPNVYTAGRLDADSEGLMLLTSDGAMQHDLTSPKVGHPRTYWVQVEGIPDAGALARLCEGLDLKDGKTLPAEVELLEPQPEVPPRDPPVRFRASIPTSWLQFTIREGRNRQIRRMTAAVGHPTLRLIRRAIGPLQLDELAAGAWRDLSAAELEALRASLAANRQGKPRSPASARKHSRAR